MKNQQLETEAVEIGLQFINGNKKDAFEIMMTSIPKNGSGEFRGDIFDAYHYRAALAVEVYAQLIERTYAEEAEDFRRYLSARINE